MYTHDACGDRTGMSLEVPVDPELVEGDSAVIQHLDYTCSSGRLTGLASPETAGGTPALFTYSGPTLVANLVSPSLPGSGVGGNGTASILPIFCPDKDAGPSRSVPLKPKYRSDHTLVCL